MHEKSQQNTQLISYNRRLAQIQNKHFGNPDKEAIKSQPGSRMRKNNPGCLATEKLLKRLCSWVMIVQIKQGRVTSKPIFRFCQLFEKNRNDMLRIKCKGSGRKSFSP